MSRDDQQVLARSLIAFLLFTASERAAWVAVLVNTFTTGGATSATLATLPQLAAVAVAAPCVAAWLAARAHEADRKFKPPCSAVYFVERASRRD